MRKALFTLLLLLTALAVLTGAADWLFGPTAAAVVGVVLLLLFGDVPLSLALEARWRKQVGPEAMIGRRASVVQPFARDDDAGMLRGKVRYRGELWDAQASDTQTDLRPGEVVIVGREGLTLIVEPGEGPLPRAEPRS